MHSKKENNKHTKEKYPILQKINFERIYWRGKAPFPPFGMALKFHMVMIFTNFVLNRDRNDSRWK